MIKLHGDKIVGVVNANGEYSELIEDRDNDFWINVSHVQFIEEDVDEFLIHMRDGYIIVTRDALSVTHITKKSS